MDGEQLFWLNTWRTIAGGLVAVVLSVSGCVGFESYQVREMVAKGADPIAARCALKGSGEGRDAVCVIKAQQR